MINIELLNLFMASTALFLKNVTGLNMKRERLSADNLPHTLHEVNVIFGIDGTLTCTVVLGMTTATSAQIASRILGEPVIEASFARNTITLIGTNVSRNIEANLNKQGHDVYARPPSLITGKGKRVSTLNSRKICISFETDVGTVDMRITL
ncbi:MAG: hypothetical protein CVU89_13180 [Firmicutes bacterium HGW-Firmicutes-14]|nr:MAG: hypothetical protein CVU89_13180 [Firmicutes bacterium HGW-Firmicutes-14]